LRIAEFPSGKTYTGADFSGGKLQLQLVEGCEGKQTLRRGDIKTGSPRKVFSNEENLNFHFYRRHTLAHNLASLYEGYTISKANSPSKLGPFIPFSYDSGGGIASMFFLSEFESNRGDVIIDCGFTKLFTELTTDGTLRYVQNVAALTLQYEKHLRRLGQKGPKTFRPTPFSFPIDEAVSKTRVFKQSPLSGPFDVLYLCDATGSMGGTIQAAKNECVAISRELASKFPHFQFQFGAVFYRDPVDSRSDRHDTFLLTNNISTLQSQIGTVCACGGADGPKDWVGAYRIALDNMNWRAGQRLIIHLADAPAHGCYYCGSTNHEEETPKLEPLIRRCAAQGMKIVGMPIGSYPQLSYDRCMAHYLAAKGPMFEIRPFGSSGMASSSAFKSEVIGAVVSAAPKPD
jgi:hypothetical protein